MRTHEHITLHLSESIGGSVPGCDDFGTADIRLGLDARLTKHTVLCLCVRSYNCGGNNSLIVPLHHGLRKADCVAIQPACCEALYKQITI
jgi:hypothetical protein